MKRFAFASLMAAALALAGCAATPSSIVTVPTTARPIPPEPAAQAANGAIFQTAQYRPLFEDRRARHIGDTLIINIVEKTVANTDGASTGKKDGKASFTPPGPLQARLGGSVSTSASTSFADGGTQSASNAFTGTIAVTVTEVLSNGNLIVAGEKQVAMNKGIEFIRFSGMVNPDMINGNAVASTNVADARVEYRTNSRIDRAEMSSMASRFFQSILPF
ncbi:flagellar basal body L-ring protein FlgH [Massilia arenosa]|uniref:Flagellar L-ring protein n=1 Tax=Zemynaea arenosa TaxID=2561931 RepID=A0A4Y9STG8_9BURK|nr:flagellar basal body L-ring protein FlgH [Massilia arenosa]TFW29911.1 flagellar basal body L-ring protein FlgH [Massilia arenosa]